jgi:DNA-binding GntR family transcriptional regulator
MIVRTELEPGSALGEADLMERIGCGRTPLRDALRHLVHEGLVEIVPRRGTFVTQVTISDLQQIFEVRLGLEEMVARLAVEYCSADDLAEFRALRARQDGGDDDEDTGVGVDGELHRLMVRMIRNQYLAQIYQRIANASLRLLYLTRCGMETKDEQTAFLAAVDTALEERDADALAETLRAHIRELRPESAARSSAAASGHRRRCGPARSRPEPRGDRQMTVTTPDQSRGVIAR